MKKNNKKVSFESNIDIKETHLLKMISDLEDALSLEYSGKIKLKLTQKIINKDNLRFRWDKYLLKYKNVEETYMSEWSPNNGTYPVIQSNEILKLVVDWYMNYERHQSIDMLDFLYDVIADKYDIDLEDYLDGKIDKNKEIDEAIEFYMGRNPCFEFDW